ncbi:MAG TPA: hypothetical protein VNE67_09110 [Acetobacteraceae bacterium]|nr:hypothetical protein [Acetobacteraceae bacterium]
MHASVADAALTWTQAFATALAPSLFALALVWLRRHKINTTVIEAVGRAAGEGYKQLVAANGGAGPVSLAAAVAQGRDYLLKRIPATLKAAGVTPEGAAQMVSGELGKLLALDPTVGVGPKPPPALIPGVGTVPGAPAAPAPPAPVA